MGLSIGGQTKVINVALVTFNVTPIDEVVMENTMGGGSG
jgi:hypothetical protein